MQTEQLNLRHQLLCASMTICWTLAYLCWSEWRSCSQAAAEAESTLPPGVAAGVCSTSLDDRLCPVYSRGGGMTSLLPEVRAHCKTRPANASHSKLALPDVPPESIIHEVFYVFAVVNLALPDVPPERITNASFLCYVFAVS